MNDIYKLFENYFDNMMMTKVQNTNHHSIYMARVRSMLGVKYRYLICICSEDVCLIGTQTPLSKLRWVSLQTRQVDEPYDFSFNISSYKQKTKSPYNAVVQIVSAESSFTEYHCRDYPNIKITLLSNKNDMYEYPDRGTISACLETYQTIVEFKQTS